eukprot:Selendium_serpulae@DN8394_c0_g1_i1.p1
MGPSPPTSLSSSEQDLSCFVKRQWNRINVIERCSHTPMRPMTIERLLKATCVSEAALINTAEWVRVELPVRIAHRLYDFHRLPYCILCNPSIRACYDTYARTFDALNEIEPLGSIAEEQAFEKVLTYERGEHDRTVDLMGQGLQQLRLILKDNLNLNDFLERFFFFRIGRRIMIDHLMSIQKAKDGWVGCFNVNCNPAKIIEGRAEEV